MTQDLTKYQKLSELQHVLARSGMYLGSTTPATLDFFVPNEQYKMILESVTTSPALVKLFDEIISNSVDEHIRSGRVTRIDVTYSTLTGQISVKDNGGIPVKKHPEHKTWIPSMIFGELRTGSNFSDDDRTTAGLNGLGSSLVNIFSKEFKVETSDGTNKLTQIFRNNMSEVNDPAITKSSDHGTTITFIPDYDRLNCTLDQDAIKRIERRVYDVAGCNPKIKVFLNGVLIKANKFTDFVSMFTDNYVSDSNDHWEVAVAPSPDDTFRHISFVNGVDTFNGGTHIDYISNQITNKLREFIKKKHKIDVKPNNIKQQMFLFIKSTINAPMFTSQTKEFLSTDVKDFGTEFEVSDAFIKKIIQSEIVQRVLDWAQAQQRQKELAALRNLEKKKKAHKSEKYFPATEEQKFLIAGEGACIEENTEIMMSDFSTKKIKDIRIGDSVLSGDMTHQIVQAKIKILKPTVTIKTKSVELICGIDHKIKVYDKIKNEFIFETAREISSNLERYKLLKSRIKNNSRYLDVISNNIEREYIELDTGYISYTSNDFFTIIRDTIIMKVHATDIKENDMILLF